MPHFSVAKFSLAKRDPMSKGLVCDEHGLTLGPAQLIYSVRGAAGKRSFRVAKLQWLTDVFAVAYGPSFDTALTYRLSKLDTIAEALTEGRLTQATIAALHLRLPELNTKALERLTLLAKYSPDQPRDWHGRWTQDGDPGANFPGILTAESKQERHNRCVEDCLHLLPSPSGDLQSSEYRKCYRECVGSLG